MLLSAGPLVALAAAALGTWQAGGRSEVRGFGGAPEQRALQLELYEVDPVLALGLEDDTRRRHLEARYAPRLLVASPSGRFDDMSAATAYHSLSLAAGWRPDPRWSLALSGSRSWGVRELSPLSQSLAPGTSPDAGDPPSPPPSSLQPNAGSRKAAYAAFSVSGSADYGLTRRWRVGTAVEFLQGGGRDEPSRAVFPMQRTAGAELRATVDLGTRDALALSGGGTRAVFDAGRSSEIWQLALRWDHAVNRSLATFAGGGPVLAVSRRSDLPPLRRLELQPMVELGMRWAEPEEGPPQSQDEPGMADPLRPPRTAWAWRAQTRVAPYVDPFTDEALSRIETRFEASWSAAPYFRIDLGAGSASVVRRSRLGPTVAILDCGVWWGIAREVDLGLTLRAGWQEVAHSPLPPWQWGAGLGVLWSGRHSL